MKPTAPSAPPPQSAEPASVEVLALRSYVEELNALRGTLSLLSWDEKTKMPIRGGASRARQKGVLASIIHERSTSEQYRRLIAAVEEADPGSDEARVCRRGLDLATKLPTAFVRESSEAASLAGQAWQHARGEDDFAGFAPHLQRLLDLTRRRAEYYGYETEPYDALHDVYEEGSRAAELAPLFEQLRGPLLRLLDAQPEPDTSVLSRRYPLAAQARFAEHIVRAIGYDWDGGRIDDTAHPFCSEIGAGDVRLTTRYQEHWLPACLFSVIHEAGHGIYDQSFHRLGLPPTIAHAPGLGMHESQSRMYENIVGRSRPFWERHYPELQRAFPEALGGVDVDVFVRQVNVAQRSLIRVEADELTYNLHVGLRFELERRMVNGELEVRDLPGAWNDAMQRWLGLTPPSDREGCLQDVHWSMGAFGYFPTYTLGNVYAAQFVEVARGDLTDFDDMLSGDLSPLRAWFDEHVYRFGSTRTGKQFVEQVTGGPVSVQPLVRYLERRFDPEGPPSPKAGAASHARA